MKYSELITKVERGVTFSVDFKKRKLKIDRKSVNLNEIQSDAQLFSCLEDFYPFYAAYKHSVPSERSESISRHYFKALTTKELSDEDFMFGAQREVARFNLEVSLLLSISAGNIKWDNETTGTWFWQSSSDKEFIILKEWVVG